MQDLQTKFLCSPNTGVPHLTHTILDIRRIRKSNLSRLMVAVNRVPL